MAVIRDAWHRAGVEASVFAGSFLLYLLTLAPDVVGHDAGEFQFVPPLLGIAHYTGYPLHTLVGWLWSLLPLGSPAYRMNLLSAVFAAGGVTAAFSLTRHLSRERWPGLVAAVALATTPLFWLWATMAGVRALSALLPLVILLLAAKWSWIRRDAGKRGDPQPGASWFYGLALAFGMGLAHHRSAMLLAPSLLFLVLATDPKQLWRWRQLGAALAWFLLPLLTYLYLPLRSRWGAPFDQFHPDSWERFWNLVAAQGDVAAHLTVAGGELGSRALVLWGELAAQMTWIGLGLVALGIFYLFWKEWRLGVAVTGFVVAVVALVLLWDVGPGRLNYSYLVPAQGVLAVYAGLGVALLMSLGRAKLGGGFVWVVPLAAVAALSFQGVQTARELNDQSYQPLGVYREELYRGLRARRLGMTSLPLIEPGAVVVAEWEQATVFWYLQLVEGINPGVGIVYPTSHLRAALAKGGPVYVAAHTPALLGYPLTMVGSLVRVKDGTEPDLAPLVPLEARFGAALEMEGHTFWSDRGAALDKWPGGRVVSLSLFWRAREKPKANYSISLRLVGDDGRVAVQQDQAHPVLGLYPTSRWAAGERVVDFYELRTPLTPGGYRLELVVYESGATGFSNLPVEGGPRRGETSLLLGPIEVR